MKSYKVLYLAILITGIILSCKVAAQGQCSFTNYTLSPNGYICSNSTTVTMSGSQTGVNYQLNGNGGNLGPAVAGTGSALSWANVPVTTGGTYIVLASKSGCSAVTVANTTIYYTPPFTASVSQSGTVITNGSPVTLSVNPLAAGSFGYIWFFNGQNIFNTKSSYSASSAGIYSVIIYNSCTAQQIYFQPITSLNATPVTGPVIPSGAPAGNNNANPELNWIQSTSYDQNGNPIAQAKGFFDDNGQALQSQALSLTTGHVLASQSLNDLYGNPAISTLSAPVYSSDFIYRPNFVSNASGAKYNTANFDGAKQSSPDPVGNSQQGTLGWYYSNNNSYEPYVPATGYPYSRTAYFQDGTSAPAQSAGIGEELRMGRGREVVSNIFPVLQELGNYLAIRNKFWVAGAPAGTPATVTLNGGNAIASGNLTVTATGSIVLGPGFSVTAGATFSGTIIAAADPSIGQPGQTGQTDLSGSSVMTIAKDQQGNWGMSIADKAGKTLMSALPGNWLTVNNSITLNNYKEEFDINGGNTAVMANDSAAVANLFTPLRLTGGGNLIVYHNNSLIYQGVLTGFQLPANVYTTDTYRFLSDQPFTIAYSANATITGSGHYVTVPVCEDCHSAISPGSVLGQNYHYFCLPQGGSLSIGGGTVRITDLLANTTLYDNQGSSVTLPAGMYKAVAESGQPALQYSTSWGNISYNFYNQKGELAATMAPNGVQQVTGTGLSNYSNLSGMPFTSTLVHDLQGRVISATSADGGFTEYIYRKDGSIRFSQNPEQRKTGRFSYTNYDADSRAIEAGEYTPGDITFAAAKANLALLENTNADGGLTNGSRQNWVRWHYDLPDNSHGQAGYVQDYLDGAVSWTENPNGKTWYSYDSEGKVTWVIRYQAATGYKTVDYLYDYLDQLTTAIYQKNTPAESFYHYYSYDADGRLANVQTSRDGNTTVQQAKYYYYLHGPLKRLELGSQLQGLDYTYTAQGALKAINHPSGQPANDPGQDGVSNGFAPDAFGMQLEYFSNDYSRSGTSISSISTGTGQTYYNGNVSGMSWASKEPASMGAGQSPAMYTYNYDNKYQLTNGTWGTPSFGSTQTFTPAAQFNESIPAYDANGNILSLKRTGANGAQTDNFSYNYTAGTNQLQGVPGYASYTYDSMGRLASEAQAATGKTVYLQYEATGKVTGIYSDAAMTQPQEVYSYDETGNRISVLNYVNNLASYYVYDAGGRVMAIYTGTVSGTPALSELPVYGASRLGTCFTAGSSISYVYELRDNAGSVRVVVNAARVNGQADVAQYNDYYPYGSIARSGGLGYRYDYQGEYAEKDAVTGFNNFALRLYDGRIGRWLSVDPAGQFASPYEGMGNNPVTGSDPTGGEDGDGPDDWYLPIGVTDQSKAIYIPGSNAVSGYTDIGPDNMNFQGGALQTVNVNSTYIYNWLGMNPGVESWDSDKNPYMLKNSELQNAAKNEALFLSIFIGGEVFAGAEAGFYSAKAMAGRAIVSAASQVFSKGAQRVDVADVGSDALLPLGLASISDAEIDIVPLAPQGSRLAIGGINKPMSQVGFEATTNLIMGLIIGDRGTARNIINNSTGQYSIDKIESSIWK